MIEPKTAAPRVALALAAIALTSEATFAQEGPSAAEMAEKLANPTAAVGQMANNFSFTEFDGDLPGADEQRGWNYLFQPVLPFPQKSGKNLLLRPAFSLLAKQPVVDSGSGAWDDEFEFGDVAFDLVYGGTSKSGLLTSYGVVGGIPTATDDAVGSDQWTLGPEVLVGVAKKWGVVGLLVNHQWDVFGDDTKDTSITGGQYFYAFPIGDGSWQIASGPAWSYNHELEGEKWSLPVGVGLGKTTMIGEKAWKFQFQYWNYAKSPDAFGPDEVIRFTITKVVNLPWGKE